MAKVAKSPAWEGVKEVGRWLALFLASALLVGVEAQLDLLPSEFMGLPLRPVYVLVLTNLGRWFDKFKFERSKLAVKTTTDSPSGLLPF